MEVVTAVTGMHAPLSSPDFNGSMPHCLLFDYSVATANIPTSPSVHYLLGVYVRTSQYVYTGRRLWFTNNTGERHVQLQIWPTSTAISFIDFVGTVADPGTTVIKIACVELRVGFCEPTGNVVCKKDEFPCRNGRECVPQSLMCDGISHCIDESDELLPVCGEQTLISLNCLISGFWKMLLSWLIVFNFVGNYEGPQEMMIGSMEVNEVYDNKYCPIQNSLCMYVCISVCMY